jgi:hypothetical protein
MLTIDQTVEKVMCLAAAMRPEWLASKRQESLAQSLLWFSQNGRFSQKGSAQKRARRVATWRSK